MEDTALQYSADELARAAGTLTSTIRMYQARGLLEPPTRVGRNAFYGPDHLDRLTTIDRLQTQGFSLASIKQLIDAWSNGEALPDVLGVRESRKASALNLSAVQFAARFPLDQLTPQLAQRAQEVGMVTFNADGTVTVKDQRFLTVGAELIQRGIPAMQVLAEWEYLRVLTDQIAARFVSVFTEHILTTLDLTHPDNALSEGVRAFDMLQPLAHDIVGLALDESLHQAAQQIATEVAKSSKPKKASGPKTAARPSRGR